MRRNSVIVLLVVMVTIFVAGCQTMRRDASARPAGNSQPKGRRAPASAGKTYGPPRRIAKIAFAGVDESSGLAASRTMPGVYWTHNDSGGGPYIYAFDSAGSHKGVWRVTGATARDWEDIAIGPGPKADTNYLYIGDIGNNSGKRSEIVIYRVAEPVIQPTDSSSTKKKPLATEAAEAFRFSYPDESNDAEALLVHPTTGRFYIVTKTTFSSPEVFAGDLTDSSAVTTLTRIGTLDLPSFFGGIITGGAISPDGQRVALCDYFQGYEIVLPNGETNFDRIWKQPIKTVDIGKRSQGESISYRLDGRALLMTSEGAAAPLIQVERQ